MTPPVTEGYKYYSDKENGIPFLRVQNLNVNGSLDLSSVKYINKETQNDLLKRSKVYAGDLLIKITGVGRMAISSVAPENFIGNINQHIVVIRTESNDKSKYLAKYLNLDIIEQLASRRATGGTRPALDYSALKSIPIIEGVDFSIIDDAYQQKQAKEAEAKELLAGIDDYLLAELGIILPEQDNSLQKRIFTTNFSQLTGSRFDPKLYDLATTALKNAITKSTYDTSPLGKLIIHSCSGDWGIDENEIGSDSNLQRCLVIRATEFDNEYNLDLSNSRVKYRLINIHKLKRMDLCSDDLLIEKSGGSPDQPVGRVALVENTMLQNNNLGYSNFIHKIRVNTVLVYPAYLFCILKMMHNIKLTDSMQSQTNGIRNLIMSNYLAQQIPLPPLEKQQEIAEHVREIRQKAKQLQEDGAGILANAKMRVEQMILGG